jgi:hypothetical protein
MSPWPVIQTSKALRKINQATTKRGALVIVVDPQAAMFRGRSEEIGSFQIGEIALLGYMATTSNDRGQHKF